MKKTKITCKLEDQNRNVPLNIGNTAAKEGFNTLGFIIRGSETKIHIEMFGGGVYRKEKHCFGFLTVAKLLACFYEN